MKVPFHSTINVILNQENVEQDFEQQSVANKPLFPSHDAKKVFRRKKAGSGFLNFYDLGLVKSGDTFVDWDYYFLVDMPSNTSANPGGASVENVLGYSQSIFSVPFDQWTEKFYRITKDDAVNYDLQLRISDTNLTEETKLDNTNDKWTDEGLKVDEVKRIAFYNYGAFYPFDTKLIYPNSAQVGFKITASNNYNAPEVELKIVKGADVFLIPMLAQYVGTAIEPVVVYYQTNQYVLDNLGTSIKRSKYKGGELFKHNYIAPEFYQPIRNINQVNTFIDYLRNLPGARSIFLAYQGGSTLVYGPPSGFPSAGQTNVSMNVSMRMFTAINKQLIAVIQSDDKVYYIWSKSITNMQGLSPNKSQYFAFDYFNQ